jgi:acetyl esterase
MAVNESTKAFLAQAQAMGIKPFHQYSPANCKALFAQLMSAFGTGPEVGPVNDHQVQADGGTVEVRVFQPKNPARGTILHCHGGGWVMGSADDYDGFARRLVAATGWAVALVDYRLAPEHPFPIPLEDCWAALSWFATNASALVGPGLSLVLAGDSAGGNLAAVLAQRARERGAPAIAAQVLVYPPVQTQTRFPSQTDPDCQLLLCQADMDWFWGHYAPQAAQQMSPEAAPLLARDLQNLPPTLVITAGHDPLRDEGAAYADRLKQAGTHVVYRNYPEDMHGFVTLPQLTSGEEALRDIASFLSGYM